MFSMPFNQPQNFYRSMESVFLAVLDAHGLQSTTDVAQGGGAGLPFGLGEIEITAEDREQWSDDSGVDKLFNLLYKACKTKPKPVEQSSRILAVLPGTCSVMAAVAFNFTPAPAADALALSSTGTWTVVIWGRESAIRAFQGNAFDHLEMAKAQEYLTQICADIQKAHDLKPTIQQGLTGMPGLLPEFQPRI